VLAHVDIGPRLDEPLPVRRFAVTSLIALVACSAAPPPPPPAPSATTAPTAAPAPSTSAAPAAPETPEVSPFHVAVKAEFEPYLVQVGKTLLVGTWGQASFLEVRPDGFALREDLAAGIDVCRDTIGLDWRRPGNLYAASPEAQWLSVTSATARTSFHDFLRWSGGKWVKTRIPQIWSAAFDGPFHYRRSTFLMATNVWARSYELVLLDGPDPLPRPAQSQDTIGSSDVHPGGALSFPGGNFLVVGSGPKLEGLFVERFTEPAAKGTIEEILPDAFSRKRCDEIGFVGTALDDLYVGVTCDKEGFLLHREAKGWKKIETPITEGIGALALAADGTLWLAHSTSSKDDGVWTFRPPAAWSRIPLPPRRSPLHAPGYHFYPRPDGEMWISDQNGHLLRNGPPHPTYTWANDNKCPPVVAARPATAACPSESVFVLLYTLNKVTPKDYDFPLLRAALKGHREFEKFRFAETEENHKRYFVAWVDPDAYPPDGAGRALAKLVKEKVQGASPQVLCGRPRMVRELGIDVMTGNVKR
jgi:hypothetical protein